MIYNGCAGLSLSVEELRKIIREEVKRALLEALTELLPSVDEDEQREIEEVAGEPSDYSEEEFMDWRGR